MQQRMVDTPLIKTDAEQSAVHPFAAQHALFKAYDIRGKQTLFTPKFLLALSRAFVQRLSEVEAKIVVIGYDMRHRSQALAQIFADNCSRSGIKVIWLGMVTTPIMAFWANQYEGHGVIATASHSERDICGIKWLINGQSPSHFDIKALFYHLSQPSISKNPILSNCSCDIDQPLNLPVTPTVLSNRQVAREYNKRIVRALNKLALNHQTQLDNPSFNQPLTLVIDCLNGATGLFAHSLFSQFPTLYHSPIIINSLPDGNLPKGNPDPTEANRLNELCDTVRAHNADIGLAFDGDGDRLMVVDHTGTVIAPDHLLYLLARVAIEDQKEFTANKKTALDQLPQVIFDVKCLHHLPKLINDIGGSSLMARTGSSHLRRALQQSNDVVTKTQNPNQVIFAGELSGHFIFNDGHFLLHDDAMYAGLRLLRWLKGRLSSITLNKVIQSLPSFISTTDLYLSLENYPDKDHILRQFINMCDDLKSDKAPFIKNSKVSCIDGLRLDFDTGFGVIRPSNTSNSLTVRFAGDSLTALRYVQQCFVDLFKPIHRELAYQIAAIDAVY